MGIWNPFKTAFAAAIPQVELKRLGTALVIAVWFFLALAIGSIALLLVGFLRDAAYWARFGNGGVATVVLGAIAVTLLSRRRFGAPQGVVAPSPEGRALELGRVTTNNPPQPNVSTKEIVDPPNSPVVILAKPTRPPPAAVLIPASDSMARDRRQIEALDPRDPDDLPVLMRRYNDTLPVVDSTRVDRSQIMKSLQMAERILDRIAELEAQRGWCQIQRSVIHDLRRRLGLSRDGM